METNNFDTGGTISGSLTAATIVAQWYIGLKNFLIMVAQMDIFFEGHGLVLCRVPAQKLLHMVVPVHFGT